MIDPRHAMGFYGDFADVGDRSLRDRGNGPGRAPAAIILDMRAAGCLQRIPLSFSTIAPWNCILAALALLLMYGFQPYSMGIARARALRHLAGTGSTRSMPEAAWRRKGSTLEVELCQVDA